MADKNEPKTYIIDKFKKSYSSIQEIIAEESRNFAQYAVIIDRLLAEFETYDKIKSLDIKEYAIKIFSELDQLKGENEELNIELKRTNEAVEQCTVNHYHLLKSLQEIFKCLIMANRADKITETLWIDNSTTLWDYIAETLGLEGDQLEIEEQILRGNK